MINKINEGLRVLNEEYNILTSSLEVSVSKHLMDDDFTVIWANDCFYKLTGYTKEEHEEIFKNSCREYYRNDIEEFEKISKAIIDVFNNGEKKYDRICRMPCKDGKYIWIRLLAITTNEIIDGFPVLYATYSNVNELIETQNKLKTEHERLDKTLLLEETTIECIKSLYKFQNLNEKLPNILKKLIKAVNADRVYIVTQENDIFRVRYAERKIKDIKYIKKGTYLELNPSPEWRKDFANGNSIVINNAKEIKNISPGLAKIFSDYEVTRMIISPILLKGKIHSYIVVDNPAEIISQRFSIIETICRFIGIALENEKLNEVLTYNSYYDSLTGLFNRNKYLDDIQAFSVENRKIGILLMDINGLKSINDIYGHQHGDDILREGADILRATFYNSNIYRIGGDEYVVLATDIEAEIFNEKVKEVRQRLFLSRECKGALGYKWIPVSENIEKEITEVDKNMYNDKMEYYRHNQNIYRYRHENDNMLKLCSAKVLKEEIAKGNFEIFLQPKADFHYEIIGAEALIRYRDNEGNLIMPNNFITLFENSKVINIIDYFVFESICKLLRKWLEEGYDVKPISVNFSRYTLKNIDFVNKLNGIWKKYKVPKYLLEIEIIENDEEMSTDILHQVLQRIKAEGYALSIDDFGARYSNIALFIDNELDTLKIDRSLMKDIVFNKRVQLLISSFVHICNNLNIKLIIEGVETEEQFELLHKLNCDGIQGYLISKPIPIEEYKEKFLSFHD